jgi:hypothetical protein
MSNVMNNDVFVLALSGCLCLLPFIVVVGVFSWHRRRFKGFEIVIAMDGATCLKADDGSVLIKKTSIRNWVVLVILGLVLLGLIALLLSAIGNLLKGEPTTAVGALFVLIGAGAFIGGVILILIRSIRMPSISIKTESEVIEIGRGTSARRIPFSSISRVMVDQLGSKAFDTRMLGVCILLDDSEKIQLGTVSGDAKKIGERADAIAQLVADTVDVQYGTR